jgi:hypothetical protein
MENEKQEQDIRLKVPGVLINFEEKGTELFVFSKVHKS